jgi:hypothetical protein
LLWARGKSDEAESLLRSTVRSYEQLVGERHPWATETLLDLGQFIHDQGRDMEAQTILRRVTDTALGWTNQAFTGPSGRVLSGAAWQWIATAGRADENAAAQHARHAALEADRLIQQLMRAQEETLPATNWLRIDALSQMGGVQGPLRRD